MLIRCVTICYSMTNDKECPMCKSKNYDDTKDCEDCGFVGLCLSDKE